MVNGDPVSCDPTTDDLWNPELDQCDDSANFVCPISCEPTNPLCDGEQEFDSDGNLESKPFCDCTGWYVCLSGQVVQSDPVSCDPTANESWNPESNECENPDDFVCPISCSQQPSSQPSQPTNPLCNGEQGRKLPFCGCTGWYVCLSGQVVDFDDLACEPPQVWNPELDECNYPENFVCPISC